MKKTPTTTHHLKHKNKKTKMRGYDEQAQHDLDAYIEYKKIQLQQQEEKES
jgi:hypothetical protein